MQCLLSWAFGDIITNHSTVLSRCYMKSSIIRERTIDPRTVHAATTLPQFCRSYGNGLLIDKDIARLSACIGGRGVPGAPQLSHAWPPPILRIFPHIPSTSCLTSASHQHWLETGRCGATSFRQSSRIVFARLQVATSTANYTAASQPTCSR